jgi:GNAT superfamily N-acetyltransferase
MADGLVNLNKLPAIESHLSRMTSCGYVLRRAMAYEKAEVCRWVDGHFNGRWASECDISFARCPVACFIATQNQQVVGFSCFEATLKNFFGPIGVAAHHQAQGIGAALLIRSLLAMREMGYGYAIVGGIGEESAGFYQKTVGLELIAGSEPGIYADKLKQDHT